jgi:hypothetical protein
MGYFGLVRLNTSKALLWLYFIVKVEVWFCWALSFCLWSRGGWSLNLGF